MKDKCCGNCKHFTNEDVNGYGWCSRILTRTRRCSGICREYEMPNNGWTKITPDNVEEIKSIERNRVIICASNSIGYMYPSTLLSLACSLESIADYVGYYYYISSLSLAHEHCTVYYNKEYGFSFCTHTKKKANGDFGRIHRHYMYQGKVYKSLDKFLEAIKDVEFKG